MPQISPFNLTVQSDMDAYAWIQAELTRHNSGGEAIYSYDQATGLLVAEWHGAGAGGNLDPRLQTALQNGQLIVLHHNHPSNGSFIPLDLQTLVGLNPNYVGLPGVTEMWVHGNHGARYRVSVTDSDHAHAIVAADRYLNQNKGNWSISQFGHEIFNSGWRHLVCLCLEAKGYVEYDYNITSMGNYNKRAFTYDSPSRQLTMKDAFPLAVNYIISNFGDSF